MRPPHAETGDVLRLGPPASGEVRITVDAAATGSAFSAGTQRFHPGAEMPPHKHTQHDTVVFVHKGQGRVTLDDRVLLVVPGSMWHVPRGTWHGVRNTGTGALEIAWMSSPPGLDAWYRELAAAGAAGTPEALQALAQRHGIEFRPATEGPSLQGHPRRDRRRGGRRHRAARSPSSLPASAPADALSEVRAEPPSSMPVSAEAAPMPATTPEEPAISGRPDGPRRRRRRGGRGRGRRSAAPPPGAAAPAAIPYPPREPSAPAAASPSSQPKPRDERGGGRSRDRRGGGHRRFRHVKDVYIDGKWVQISGDGPVIAPGSEHGHRPKKSDDDDELPMGPLSVQL